MATAGASARSATSSSAPVFQPVHRPDSPIGRAITAAAEPGVVYPLVEVMGQAVLANPTNRQIAAAFGVVANVRDITFDLAVVGAGPAGLGAAVYGRRLDVPSP